MLQNEKWIELVALLWAGLGDLPQSDWRPDLRLAITDDQKFDALVALEFHDTKGLTEAIDGWLTTQEWPPDLSAKHLYCLRNRLFVSWFFVRHIPFASPGSETLIPFPEIPVVEACRWYLGKWYECHGMSLVAEGNMPDTFDYQRN